MRKGLLYTFLCLGVLGMAACGGDTATPAGEEVANGSAPQSADPSAPGEQSPDDRASYRPVVLFLGDSITAGYGLDPDEAFPALLQHRLDSLGIPATLINAGLSGETTAGGLRRIDWLMREPVDVLVLELGGNDGLRGIADLGITKANLQGIIDRVREENPSTVIVVAGMMIPPNLGQEYTTAFADIFPAIANENDAILIPFLLDGVGGVDSLMQRDGIHPNEAGHLKVAELTLPYLLEALAATAP